MTRTNKPLKTREVYERELKAAQMGLLAVAILSVVNVLAVAFGLEFFLYFSASVPFYLTLYMADLCGVRSPEFYEAYYGPDWQNELQFTDMSAFYVAVAIALVLSALYFLFWYLSKKSRVGMILALVYYTLDLLGYLFFAFFLFEIDMIATLIVLLFHAWVLYYLYLGVRAWNAIPTAPTQAELAAANGVPFGAPYTNVPYGASFEAPIEGEATPVEEPSAEEIPAEDIPSEDVSAPAEEDDKSE